MKNLISLIALSALTLGTAQADESFFTSVKPSNCVTIYSSDLDPQAEIDYYKGECQGLGGYKVIVEGGDLRYNLHLSYNNKKIELAELASFHDMGSEKIQWRFERSNGTVNYNALIYRLNFQDYNIQTGEFFDNTSLYVVKLDGEKTCLVGKVERSANMNEKAEAIADNAKNLSCLD